MASWWVEYSHEAANYLRSYGRMGEMIQSIREKVDAFHPKTYMSHYLNDNGELVTALFFVIEALAESAGLLATDILELDDGFYLLMAEGHFVTYRRDEDNHLILIEAIKPVKPVKPVV